MNLRTVDKQLSNSLRECLVEAILLRIGKPGTKIVHQFGKYFHKILYHQTTV